MRRLITTALLCLLPRAAPAGEADVIGVTAWLTGEDTWEFKVTVQHADEGWDHYADAWEILAPDGTVLGTRVLQHPHVDEQPFTRTLSGVNIPEDVKFQVRVRAHDTVHGYGGAEITMEFD